VLKNLREKPLMAKTVGVLTGVIVAGLGIWARSWSRTRTKQTEKESHDERTTNPPNDTAKATERYLLYFTVPLWVIAGTLDYLHHRRTKIETTSGPTESAIHALMMTEAGIPMVLGLLLEINAGVILLMIAAFFLHAATAVWDVAYAVERRKVTPGEQHVHSFLEVLPFCAVSFVICIHWNQFASLLGMGNEKASFRLKKKQPGLPKGYIAGFLGAVAINGAVYGEELLRCLRANQEGLTGTETPEAARELYRT